MTPAELQAAIDALREEWRFHHDQGAFGDCERVQELINEKEAELASAETKEEMPW